MTKLFRKVLSILCVIALLVSGIAMAFADEANEAPVTADNTVQQTDDDEAARIAAQEAEAARIAAAEEAEAARKAAEAEEAARIAAEQAAAEEGTPAEGEEQPSGESEANNEEVPAE